MIQGEKPSSTYCSKQILNSDVIYLGQQYQIIQRIGQGSFGDIYKIFDTSRNQLCAVKVEKQDQKGPLGMLNRQFQILTQMKQSQGFPKVFEFKSTEEFNFIVMSFLGINFESIKNQIKDNQFSYQTSLQVAIQMITIIRNVHKQFFLHRDIQPENFVIGTDGRHHTVYLLDFGLSKYFTSGGKHIPLVGNKGLVGTARYTSINSHGGMEQSRRDDLESLGYVMLYLTLGALPWQNLNSDTRSEKFKKIFDNQMKVNSMELCSDAPKAFQNYMDYVKQLSFEQEPDYNYLIDLFLDELKVIPNYLVDTCYDWCENDCPLKKYQLDYVPAIKFSNGQKMDEQKQINSQINIGTGEYEEQQNELATDDSSNSQQKNFQLDLQQIQKDTKLVDPKSTDRVANEDEERDGVEPLQKNSKPIYRDMIVQTNQWTSQIHEEKISNYQINKVKQPDQSIYGGMGVQGKY